MKIKNRIIKTESLNWQDIKDLQPVNLKTPINLEHLKNSLVKHGFSKAFDVWQDPKTKEIYFVDGHTRSDTLRELISDGYDIPEKLTCNFLEAESKEKAVKILLEVHNQKLNPIDQETMEVWLEEIDIPLEQIEVDSLNFFVESEELEEEEEEEEKPEEGQDNVPALKKDPFVVRGDIFEIKAQGLKYRIGCLDSTDSKDINELVDPSSVNFILSDPPYGMKLDTDFSDTGGKNYRKVIGDNDDFSPKLITTFFDNFPKAKEVFLFGFDYYAELIPNRKAGSVFVWDKKKGLEDVKYSLAEFELIWSKTRHARSFFRYQWFGMCGTQYETGETQQGPIKRVHPNQKPTILLEEILNTYSAKNANVVDLYAGSGSTLIACIKTKRNCFTCDIDEHYTQITLKRAIDFLKNNQIEYEVEWNGLEFDQDLLG